MRSLRDDSGIAFGLIVVALFTLLGGAYVIMHIPFFNSLIDIFNTFISIGMVSQQTADNMTFIKNVIGMLMLFLLIGVLAWAWVRAKEDGGYNG